MVHSRDAIEDTLEILKKKEGNAIIQCFSGEISHLKEALDGDYYVSIGVMLFRAPDKCRKIVERTKWKIYS